MLCMPLRPIVSLLVDCFIIRSIAIVWMFLDGHSCGSIKHHAWNKKEKKREKMLSLSALDSENRITGILGTHSVYFRLSGYITLFVLQA